MTLPTPRKLIQKLRAIQYAMTSRVANAIEGRVLGNTLSAYWYSGFVNFGDLLTPLVLKQYGWTPMHAPIDRATVLSTGSILQWAPEDYAGHIVGSGLMRDTTIHFKKAVIWAVRGELTRERIGASKQVMLGDPGLLSSELINERQRKCYSLGIVLNYADKRDPRIANIHKRYRKDTLVINVMRAPLSVLNDIDKCECILSSSLHGIITADSFGIPNVWTSLSKSVFGSGFKFHDYWSAIGKSAQPLSLTGNEKLSELLKSCRKPPQTIGEAKAGLDKTFRSLRDYLGSK